MSPGKKSGSGSTTNRTHVRFVRSPGVLSRVIYFLNQLRRSVCRARGVVLRKKEGERARGGNRGRAIPGEARGSCRVRKEGEKIGNTDGIGGA